MDGRLKTRLANAALWLGSDDLVRLWRRVRGRKVDHISGDLSGRFNHIYQSGHWLGGNEESLSGPGSSIEATASIREELPALLLRLGVDTLLDVGCGDYNWMSRVELPCRYIGVDIVASVIAENQARHGDDRHRFEVSDACSEALPKADAVLCREVLFHLSFRDMARLIENVRATGARHFIATTAPRLTVNADIPSGEWRECNLAIAPLNLGAPVETLSDDGWVNDRLLGVWRL